VILPVAESGFETQELACAKGFLCVNELRDGASWPIPESEPMELFIVHCVTWSGLMFSLTLSSCEVAASVGGETD